MSTPATDPAITGSTSAESKDGIEYYIGTLEGDVTGAVSDSAGVTLTTICTVAWGDRKQWEREMRGWTTNGDGALTRVLPEMCPLDDKLYCLSVELFKTFGFAGEQDANAAPAFSGAVYRVTWGVPQFVLKEDEATAREYERYVMWSWKGVSSYQQIPGGALKFISDGISLDKVPVRAARYNELVATWLQVPYANADFLNDLMGKINSTAVTFDDHTFAAETLLFETWEKAPKIDSRRNRVFDLTLRFKALASTSGATDPSWNKFLRVLTVDPGPPAVTAISYELATTDGTITGGTAFESADLQDCFG